MVIDNVITKDDHISFTINMGENKLMRVCIKGNFDPEKIAKELEIHVNYFIETEYRKNQKGPV